MGLERSWVSSSWNWRVMGCSSARGARAPPACTLMLTTGVLITGRFGTLRLRLSVSYCSGSSPASVR